MSWFPKWQPYTGDINTQPVAANEYLPVGRVLCWDSAACLGDVWGQRCLHLY